VIPDILAPSLTVVFVGTSKSTTSARVGHYYANPQNMFWNLLEATGLTSGEWLGPSRDREVLKHGIGLTDIVPNKAASSDALLRRGDYDVVGLVQKVEQFEPKIIAFNGEKAATRVARHLKYLPPSEGPAHWTLGHALVYRLPSSSSANAKGGYYVKRAKWVEFGEWAREQVSGP
jgi:TDG/mug DNA glycosylase family protein